MRRVHREATECVGANRLGRNRRWKQGLAYRRTEETALCSTTWSKRDPVHQEGYGVPQNEGNRLLFDLLRSKRGPVDREGCGVPQKEETD